MSDKSSTRFSSHAALWTVIVALALPVLYVLSVPPVVYYTYKSVTSRHRMWTPAAIESDTKWLEYYTTPYGWLVQVPLLDKPLQNYWKWWFKQK